MTAPDLLPQAAPCAAPGCRRPAGRGRLCVDHADKLGATLADLAADLTATSDVSISGWRTGSTSGGPLKSERDLINFRLLDAQREAPPVLAAWASWLVEQRTDLVRSGGPAGDRELLSRHLGWIVGREEVTDLWCQLRGLWHSLRGNSHLVCRDCGDAVWSEPGSSWCAGCSRAWAGSELLKLGRPERAA